MLENRYKEIFEKAKKLGIPKIAIARRVFPGRKSPWIYILGAPTRYEQYTYARLNKALEEIVKEREEDAKKN